MKLVVIGLDGVDPGSLLGDEELPNLRRLMEVGLYGELESVLPPSRVPSWACLATGRDPGSLGVYGAEDRADRSYAAPQAVHAGSIRVPAVADRLAGAGRRVVRIGVPPWDAPVPAAEALAAAREAAAGPDVGLVHAVLDGIVPAAADGPRRESLLRDACRRADEEIGSMLALLDDRTAVLVVTDRGSQRSAGAFRVNDWLSREGLLVLDPTGPARRGGGPVPLDRAGVDWDRTTCWAVGGEVARIYLNVRGREPRGAVDPAAAHRVREEIASRLASVEGPGGLGTQVLRPETTWRALNGVAPDLVVRFGDLAVRADADVGHAELRAAPGAEGGDGPRPTMRGAFVLAAPGRLAPGEVEGARLVDLAPTLLDLAGLGVPAELDGRSLVPGAGLPAGEPSEDEEQAIRERLSGLGYI